VWAAFPYALFVSQMVVPHAHREASDLVNDIPEESGHFRFLRTVCLGNMKGLVGLIQDSLSSFFLGID
jgi:hypothetical protein